MGTVLAWLADLGIAVLKIVGILLVAGFLLAMVLYFFPQLIDPAYKLADMAHGAMLSGWVEPLPTILTDLSGGGWVYVVALIGMVPALYLAWWVYRVLRIFL